MDRRTIPCGNRLCTSIARLWLGVTCCAATAQTVVYDQTSNPTGGLYVDPRTGTELPTERLPAFLRQEAYSVALLGGVGQSFTAGTSLMNVFELFTFTGSPGATTVETFVAHLRLGGPQGPLLARSEPVTFHEYPRQLDASLTQFRFSTGINLTPGEVYYCGFERTFEQDTFGSPVWSVGAVKQFSRFGVSAADRDAYRGGQLYLDGKPVTDVYLGELWFRTGFIVPEPGTWALLTLGLGALGWRWRVGRVGAKDGG